MYYVEILTRHYSRSTVYRTPHARHEHASDFYCYANSFILLLYSCSNTYYYYYYYEIWMYERYWKLGARIYDVIPIHIIIITRLKTVYARVYTENECGYDDKKKHADVEAFFRYNIVHVFSRTRVIYFTTSATL